MKKVILSVLTIVLSSMMFLSTEAQTNKLPLPGADKYDTAINQNRVIQKIPDDAASSETKLGAIFGSSLLRAVNIVVSAVGLVWLMILASKFVMSQGSDEKISKYKQEAGYIVMGLMLVALANFIANLFNPATEILTGAGQDAFASSLYNKTKVITTYLRYIVGGIMTLVGGMAAFRLVSSGDAEEKRSAEKTFIKAFFISAITIVTAETMVQVLALETVGGEKVSTEAGVYAGILEVSGIINFILTFIGGAAFILLIFAALFYIISFGQEEQISKAKRMMLYCIIAIVVSLAAYTLVSFVAGLGPKTLS